MAGKRGPSIQRELLLESREAALNAVQTFNNPLTTFKSETFIVLMIIAWTRLLHAYYRRKGVEYRYFTQGPIRRKFDRTMAGAFKYWELARCLNYERCPIDQASKQNLRFLIGLRHEIEHHKSAGSDDHFSGRYLACCLNYERYICELFGKRHSLGESAAFIVHFKDLNTPQEPDEAISPLPSNVAKYLQEFDAGLDDTDFRSSHFSYKMIFVPKLANHSGKADRAIEFIGPDSEFAKEVDKQYWVQKEVERPKYLPKQIVLKMKEEGYPGFGMYQHTLLWKRLDAKIPGKGYGVQVANNWYWYDRWVDKVRRHCSDNVDIYKPKNPILAA